MDFCKCKKCGGGSMIGPRYNALQDSLDYLCATCGYSESRPPRDRKLYTAEDIRKILA